MTAAELIQKVNLHYDNILSAAAPGLNEYEISLYLTQAHKEVVAGYYNGILGGAPVDSTEGVKSLISRYILTDSILLGVEDSTNYFGLYKHTVVLNHDVLQLLGERILNLKNSSNIIVKPIDIDEWLRLAPNPFRQPSDIRVWRLDITTNEDTTEREIQLLSKFSLKDSQYIYTYMKEPEPIILVDLDTSPWTSMGQLSIMGQVKANVDDTGTTKGLDSKISPTLWELIINRAVELATRDYKENNLNSQIALNRRME